MSYYRDLALALRGQRLKESQVLDALNDVRAHCAATGESPVEAFGDPKTYAEAFERQDGMTPGGLVLTVAAVIAVCAVAAQVIVSALRHEDFRWGPLPVGLGVALGFCILGFVVGFLVDYRLPSGFSRRSRPKASEGE